MVSLSPTQADLSPRLDLCSRSLLSILLGNALSLAIGKAHYLGSLSTLAKAWCFLAHKARSTRDGINACICISLSAVFALH